MTELDELLHDYFERTNAQEGQPKLDMNWRAIQELERNDKLCIFCARIEDKLVGFAMYVLMKHLHHASTLWALCDILAVNPDERGKGIASAIVKHAENKFRYSGVDMMVHGYRTIYDTEPLFGKLGFTCREHVYMKAL